MYDYFVADSDEAAAATLDVLGGPSVAGLPTVELKNIDPVVVLGRLYVLLTGATVDEAIELASATPTLAIQDDEGEQDVVVVPDAIRDALASADNARLVEVARPWSRIEEFWFKPDPAEMAEILKELAALARGARGQGHRLYCWVCV